ncbi:MAG TPA: ribosomal protein L7/L12 [Ktedonobacteraceae bacterium]
MQTFFEIASGVVLTIVIVVEIAIHRRPPKRQPSSLRQAELDAKLQHPDELRQLINEMKKIQAIKLYRVETGANLQEAKRAVDHFEAQMRRDHVEVPMATSHTGEGKVEEVRRLMQTGQKIKAIKAYRQATGVGLKEAKAAVERMAARTNEPLSQARSAKTKPGLVDPEKLQSLIREGRKLEAIKYIRQQRGVGLKEAKEAVDWLEANLNSQ